jgi:hypothetical protein
MASQFGRTELLHPSFIKTMAPEPSTNHQLRVKIRLGNRQSETKLLRFSPAAGTMTMAALVRLIAAKWGVENVVDRSSTSFKVYLDGEALVEDVAEIDDQDNLVLVVSRRVRGIGNDDTGCQTDQGDGDDKAGGAVAAGTDQDDDEDVADAKPATKVTTNAITTGRGRGSGKDDTGCKLDVDGDDKACGVIEAEEEDTKRAVRVKKETTTAAVAADEPSSFVGRRVAVYFHVNKQEELYFGSVVEFIASNNNNNSSSNNKTRKTNEGETNDHGGCSWKVLFDDGDVIHVARAELDTALQRAIENKHLDKEEREKARGSTGANKKETKQAIQGKRETATTAALAIVEPSKFKGRRVAAYFNVAGSKRKKLYFGSVADFAASSCTWKIEYDDGDVFYVDRTELVAGFKRANEHKNLDKEVVAAPLSKPSRKRGRKGQR